MSLQEVLDEIYKMSLSEQKTILEKISQRLKEGGSHPAKSRDEVYQYLFEKGVITHVPLGMSDDDDDFIPLKISGEPVSETIIRERR